MPLRMMLHRQARTTLNAWLNRHGFHVIPDYMLYDWQKAAPARDSRGCAGLPDSAECWLSADNPRLKELQERYASFNAAATAPYLWTRKYQESHDMRYFRGDNGYVWQLRGRNMHPMAYVLTAYYVQNIDRLGLLERLTEDELFGVITFLFNGRLISRDLLDSIIEIHFLEKHLGISSRPDLTVLDIGAGYGRLAHRMCGALPNLRAYLCADSIPVSTFVCDYYLRYRGLDKARSVPLDEIERTLERTPADLAVNVHSFSECRPAAVGWWLALLRRTRVRHLMIVPNYWVDGGDKLLLDDRQDLHALLRRHGYRLVVKEPKYREPAAQEYGINPTWHYLFELID